VKISINSISGTDNGPTSQQKKQTLWKFNPNRKMIDVAQENDQTFYNAVQELIDKEDI
jgi:hypothetical protein